MAKRICIYLLAVLFLGSVAHVNATPIKHLKDHDKKFGRSLSKYKKIKLENYFKNNSKKELHASFLEKIKKFESKIYEGKNKNGFKNLIGKKFTHIKSFRGYQCKPPNHNPVPEPSSMLLLGCGILGLAGWGRKKLKKK